MSEVLGSCERSVRISPHLHKLLGSCEGSVREL